MTYHLVFDSTDPKSPRFIELEDSTGHSISAGEWRERKDGYVELVLPAPETLPELTARMVADAEIKEVLDWADGLSKDCTQTSVELLQRFADQYRSGAAGAEMDCDAAQALAEAIDSSIRASEAKYGDKIMNGWHPVKTAPSAMTVLACYFHEEFGEWSYRVEMSPPQPPYTHWQPLPSPPVAPAYDKSCRAMVTQVINENAEMYEEWLADRTSPPKPLSYEGEQS